MKRSIRDRLLRIFLIVFSILLILMGADHIMRGSLGWKNYWGELVFPPFVVIFGLLLIYVAIFRWRKLPKISENRKGRVSDTVKDDWMKW